MLFCVAEVVPVDQSTATTKKNPDGTTTTTVPNPSSASAPNPTTNKVALLATNVKNLKLTPVDKNGNPTGTPVVVKPDTSNPTKPTEVTFTPPVKADHFVIEATPENPSKPTSVNVLSVTHADDGIYLIIDFQQCSDNVL